MTTPRIYVYKITFEEIRHYYYGVHKEKKFGEYYMGSPKTHKWMWDFYTPQIQILQVFKFSDEGYKEAREIEDRLIRPVFNTDPFCLNEHCGGAMSLDSCRKGGQLNKENGTGFFALSFEEKSQIAKKNHENGVGCFSLTREQLRENGAKVGRILYETNKGLFSMSHEERFDASRKGGETTYKNNTGCFSITPEQRKVINKKMIQKNKENCVGIFKMTPEERSAAGKKGGKSVSSQKWKCTVTGFVSTPGPLTRYQVKRGIDPSNRIRIQ